MIDFKSFLDNKSLEPSMNDVAWSLFRANEAGIDVSVSLSELNEGLGQRFGSALGQGMDNTATAAWQGANAAGRGLWRGLKAGAAGIGSGLYRGAQQAGRSFIHGNQSQNPSFSLQDAMGFVQQAVERSEKLGQPAAQIKQNLEKIYQSLNNQIQNLQNIENNPAANSSPTAGNQSQMGQQQQQQRNPYERFYPPSSQVARAMSSSDQMR